ncbi:MAG: class I SAM-dependent methyltransferase [Trichodesmium sp. St15_bin1_1]|jgi:demethylmenaquinone methyltransferase/2-methoxy-6-polyprenyl-1,4-benzoquinol methylase|nr:class I SAM-dependent methyltransferase [Trichodesmium sp. St5_bin2_1]MDE5082019.1 class I SAM-dependent methyltransferase [Trichodesmium sp. St18_bin1]MDE5086155.1 class I SAM-dependent methyltransferase [Trichodesmium sp. St16_bin2-tuft]MDE5109690.1 class I SAM-dependent methyltransferase [Trichodesmium sp. St17_bin3_1_1]MDE5111412.1 class I SAM-dependent methyltransferase [Trichodesmium sp. St7_bin2_1]MDE5113749.1 class I SAM-dependent methyltransferase [Trichodesmium sp. St15_bin1_1]MD
MATILRDWSYRYQWLYDGISRLASLSVGGETRFRQLALQGLTINQNTQILDLCCGSGQTTNFLVKYSQNVTGLDASPLSINRAKKNVPSAKYVEGFAEDMPFSNNQFDLVHTSAALHEMNYEQLRQIIQEVYRILKPSGIFTFVDFHSPTNPLFWPGLAMFLWLFETETSWNFIDTNILDLLKIAGFNSIDTDSPLPFLYVGGSLQVVQVKK